MIALHGLVTFVHVLENITLHIQSNSFNNKGQISQAYANGDQCFGSNDRLDSGLDRLVALTVTSWLHPITGTRWCEKHVHVGDWSTDTARRRVLNIALSDTRELKCPKLNQFHGRITQMRAPFWLSIVL